MGYISTIFVHKLLSETKNSPDRDQAGHIVHQHTGIDQHSAFTPADTISDQQFFDLLEDLVALNTDFRSLPVRIGLQMRCDDYGAFGFAFKTAPDLSASYKRVERFGKVITTIANFQLLDRGNCLYMAVIPTANPRPGLRMCQEMALAAALALSREVQNIPFIPRAVHLSKPAHDDTRAIEALFKCPVHHHSEWDALEIDKTTLSRNNRMGDKAISAFMDAHVSKELAQLNTPPDLVKQIEDCIIDCLSEGIPSLATIADECGTSPRTLQRRLKSLDISYKQILASARIRLACHLLLSTNYALAEIAFLTGFADQTSFSRAFRRKMEKTPAQYRLRK